MKRHDVIVIGGGQAGLAIGYLLAQQGRDFTILEAADAPAAAWRGRWDSLRLFTPVRHDSLPGRAFPGDPDRYPTRDEVVDYLTDYVRRFELPVEYDSRVRSLRREGDAYVVALDGRTERADQVVVATGPFQVPRVPALAERLDPGVVQLHSASTAAGADARPGPSSWWAAATPASRSPRSSPACTRCTFDRLPPAPAAAAHPRARPVRVPDRQRADGQDRRLADRPAAA